MIGRVQRLTMRPPQVNSASFFFFSLSLALVFFLDQFLFREGEREGLICGEA